MNCFIFESVVLELKAILLAVFILFKYYYSDSMCSFEIRCQSNETRATSTTAHFISIETLILCYFIHVVLMIF